MMENLLDILKKIKPDVDFANSDNLVDEGILDSLDIVTVIAAIEAEYNIEINPDDIDPDNFQSVHSMYHLIEKNRKNDIE